MGWERLQYRKKMSPKAYHLSGTHRVAAFSPALQDAGLDGPGHASGLVAWGRDDPRSPTGAHAPRAIGWSRPRGRSAFP
jgi:hypothetical protein